MNVFVTICGDMIGVSENQVIAERQVTEMINARASHIVSTAKERGDYFNTVRVRVAYVEVNR